MCGLPRYSHNFTLPSLSTPHFIFEQWLELHLQSSRTFHSSFISQVSALQPCHKKPHPFPISPTNLSLFTSFSLPPTNTSSLRTTTFDRFAIFLRKHLCLIRYSLRSVLALPPHGLQLPRYVAASISSGILNYPQSPRPSIALD